MKNKCLASFIIINYNGRRFLERLIRTIKQQTVSSFEIIMVDNASTDDSIEFVAKKFPQVKIIKSTNIGYGRGCNLGSKQAIGDFFVFLNPDIYLEPDYLEKITQFYYQKQKQYRQPIGSINSKFVDFDIEPSKYPDAVSNIIDIFGTPQALNDVSRIEDTFLAFGAAMFINAHTFKVIGGFHPNIFLYGEELDLCWRLKTHGYRNLITNDTHFFHFGGGSFGSNRPKQIALMTYGCFIASFSNYQSLTLLAIIPVYFVYLLLLTLLLPITQKLDFSYSLELLSAFKSFFTDFDSLVKFRRLSQAKRTVTDYKLSKYITPVPSILNRFLGKPVQTSI